MKKLFCICAGLLILCSCRDKCKDVQPTSAGFRMYRIVERNDFLVSDKIEKITVEEDTFMVNSTIIFEAVENNAISYEWLIGEDDRPRNGKSISVFFGRESLQGEYSLDIRLIVRKQPNKKCNPNDDGIDTLTRKLTFLDLPDSPFYGRYWGTDTNKPNEFYEIEILYGKSPCNPLDPPQCFSYYLNLPLIKGLRRECDNAYDIYFTRLGLSSAFVGIVGQDEGGGYCFHENQEGLAFLSPDRQAITIEYYPISRGGKIKKTFKGKRL